MTNFQRVLTGIFCALTLSAAAPGAAAAQDSPADTAQVLYDVAVQLEEDGRTDLASAIYELILERYPGASVVASARQRLATRRAERPEEDDGRVELMVWGTLYGLWLGAAVPTAFDATDVEAYGAGLLLGGPVGLYSAHRYTRDRFVGEGEAGVLTLGGTWGTWQGLGWQAALDLGVDTEEICYVGPDGRRCYDEDREDSTEELMAAGILGGLAGLAVGGAFVRGSDDITPGTSTLINFGALWGTYYAFSLSELWGVDIDEDRLLWLLLGGDIGLAATALAAPGWDMSRSRARLINIAGVAGLVGGFGLDLLLSVEDDETFVSIPMVTSAIGLAAGALLTRGRDAEPRDNPYVPGAGAMLEWRPRSGLAVNAPMPLPALLRRGPAADARSSLGVRLRVFDARF